MNLNDPAEIQCPADFHSVVSEPAYLDIDSPDYSYPNSQPTQYDDPSSFESGETSAEDLNLSWTQNSLLSSTLSMEDFPSSWRLSKDYKHSLITASMKNDCAAWVTGACSSASEFCQSVSGVKRRNVNRWVQKWRRLQKLDWTGNVAIQANLFYFNFFQ